MRGYGGRPEFAGAARPVLMGLRKGNESEVMSSGGQGRLIVGNGNIVRLPAGVWTIESQLAMLHWKTDASKTREQKIGRPVQARR